MTTGNKKKLTLRLNEVLIEQAKAYAARHHLSVSELVESYFIHLEQNEGTEHTDLVVQLSGLLPADLDAKATYRDQLSEKYGFPSTHSG